MARQLQESQDRAINQQSAIEKKLRSAQEEGRLAKEETEEVQTELASVDREYKYKLQEIESKHATLEQTLRDLRADLENKASTLQTAQDRLSLKEKEAGESESEVLRLKAKSGDEGTGAILQKQLSEQVDHIRRLESTNRDQLKELTQFRRAHKAVEIVEEEKRALESRVSVMDKVQQQLRETEIQRQILEDERRSWTSFLQSEGGTGQVEFENPEDMARALIRQQTENASLVEQMGAMQPELLEKDEIIKSLENEKHQIQTELGKLKVQGAAPPGGIDSRTKKALERARGLALKEVEFLREQLRTFDSEEQTYHSENAFDEQKSSRIAELESQLDDHRREIANLTSELSTLESQVSVKAPQSPLKRPREDDGDDRLGQLSRKNRKLQDSFGSLQSTHNVLQSEHKALQTQLKYLQESAKTRILSLRSNPTADLEAIKLSTLNALRQENKDLLAQLEGHPDTKDIKNVPSSTLDSLRLEMQALEREVAEKEKRMLRLKQIWSSKSLELREAVFSLLGWQIEFRANGKFALSLHTGNDADEVDECLIFDGDAGTMKVAGGPESAFALQVRPLIRQWVEGRGYIPGLMASILLSKIDDGTVVM